MTYAEGQIFCKTFGSAYGATGGADEVSIGNEPLLHKHGDTKAETLTSALAKDKGGDELVGNFTIGNKELLTNGKYGPAIDLVVKPLAVSSNGIVLTYPLYGQNVLDWRSP